MATGGNGAEAGAGAGGEAASAGDTSLGGAGAGGTSGAGGKGATGGTGGTSTNGGEGGAGGEGHTGPLDVGKVDLLLVVDNSISMYDKQAILSATIPKLVARLVDPWCTGDGNPPTPASNGTCPSGTHREIPPVTDMHVGVITTSLGDHGSNDVCSAAQDAANQSSGMPAANYNDQGHLLPSVRTGLPSWNGSGFLNWDPLAHSSPVGQGNVAAFVADVRTLVEAAGSRGCGYESTLEAAYRFLSDPEPPLVIGHDTITSVTTVSTDPSNIDQTVLDQRAAFLRPDSAVVVVVLSDENDCSINDDDGRQGWLVGYKGGVGTLNFHMPRGTSACATNPNSTDCRPCVSGDSDSACSAGQFLTLNEDSMNLRCFHEKQRFGIDLLYPVSRYVRGLGSSTVPKRSGGSAENPLLAGGRDPRLVIYVPIVGVPWQDLAEDYTNQDSIDLMTAAELQAHGRWPMLVGDFADYVPPTDPFMVESIDPRSGTNPVTSVAIAAPTATPTDLLANINGHEQAALPSRDDLQFACIFPMAQPFSVSACAENPDGCDCNADEYDKHSPLCDGTTATADGSQLYAKAYPGTRHLEVARELGDRAVVGSVCARNTTVSSRDDYGYVPAMRALQARLAALAAGQ